MALYINGNKVVNSLIIDGQIGEEPTPFFSETKIVDNSSLASSFTFTEDYHNYDFIRFKLYNSSSGVYTQILTTPSSIDAIFNITTKIILNEFHSNQGVNYSQNGLTWTRTWQRNIDIYEVLGLNCVNAIVEETEIYKASSISSTPVEVTTQKNLMDFDWIIFTDNDSDSDELLPSQTIFIPSKGAYNADGMKQLYCCQNYNFYSFSEVEVWIDKHKISAHPFTYIVGIKFEKIKGRDMPQILHFQSANRASIINNFSYTFTKKGNFQYYIMDKWGDAASTVSEFSIQLNGVDIKSNATVYSNSAFLVLYGDIVADVNDILTVTTNTTRSNSGINFAVFMDADTSNFKWIGFTVNGGTAFDYVKEDTPFLEVYGMGYYSGNNNYEYHTGIYQPKAITYENGSKYWYGGTYAIRL